VSGVSEVASFGGFVKQYQVVLDQDRLRAYGISIHDVRTALERNNDDVGGSVLELSEREYMVRSRGYVRGLEDLAKIAVGRGPSGVPIRLSELATLQVGGEARRGVGELDGKGEAVGGIVVARFGENANQVIADAKKKLKELEAGLPEGISIKITYDRSLVIGRAVDTLSRAVVEELIVTALICLVFLLHLRSAFVAVIVLPIGLLTSILAMNALGINANIMSLGGLALAIGVMVDSGIVMIENAHQRLHEDGGRSPRADVVLAAAREVGPSLFFSLLVITVSFLPIFVLGEESGRMFKPLAYTKTFAMAAGAVLGITVVPALMVLLVRGRIPHHDKNPLNRLGEAIYDMAFRVAIRHPFFVLLVVLGLGASTWYPLSRIGSEFMPKLDEGDLLYMPTTDPSIGVGKGRELLQQTDKLIARVPEVLSVHGKIGRAETATDPAPLSMIETVVQLEPDRSKWRKLRVERVFDAWPAALSTPLAWLFPPERPITVQELKTGWNDPDGTHHAGLDEIVRVPGVANAWPFPIENRINMLSTGIKTPVGIKLFGPDLAVLADLAQRSAAAVSRVSGTLSAYPDNTVGGYLPRHRRRPRPDRALLSVARRRAGRDPDRDRRHDRRDDDRGSRALPDHAALRARAARRLAGAADDPRPDAGRAADPARPARADLARARPADAAQRERADDRPGVRRHHRPRPRRLRRGGQARRRGRGPAAARLHAHLGRHDRVPREGQRAPARRDPDHAAADRPPAVPVGAVVVPRRR
jgi:Cu(I)/Ag(I) efflux system membrane protein CusA/SilA